MNKVTILLCFPSFTFPSLGESFSIHRMPNQMSEKILIVENTTLNSIETNFVDLHLKIGKQHLLNETAGYDILLASKYRIYYKQATLGDETPMSIAETTVCLLYRIRSHQYSCYSGLCYSTSYSTYNRKQTVLTVIINRVTVKKIRDKPGRKNVK
jgi:hypothetical protein